MQHASETMPSNLGYLLAKISLKKSTVRRKAFKQLFAVMNADDE